MVYRKPNKAMEEINQEPFYAWVAPDGTVQVTLLAPDEPTAIAVAKMWHKAGYGKSPHEMKLSGFTIQPILLTITKVSIGQLK